MIIFETLFCEPFAKFTEYARLLNDLWLKCSTNNKPIISMTMKNSRLSMRGLCNCRVDIRQNWFLKLFFSWNPLSRWAYLKRTLSSSKCKSETVKWFWTTYSSWQSSWLLFRISDVDRFYRMKSNETEWSSSSFSCPTPRQDVLINGFVFLTDNCWTFWWFELLCKPCENIMFVT